MDAQDEIKLSGLILQRSLEFVNDDEAWREFGYDKRPRYGSFFQKLRDQWKVNLERNLYREIIYFHIAFSFKNIDIIENEDQLESIIILLAYDLSGDNTNDDVYKDFGFNKREEFVDHIITSVQKYINTPTSEITNSFLENIKFGEIPNAEKKAEIIKGITFLKLLFSSHLNENQDEKKSVLGEKESNLSNELKGAKENNDWEKIHLINFKMKWISFLKKKVSSKSKNPYKELNESDLKLPTKYKASEDNHISFCSAVIADVGDELSGDHSYKMCYYKPMSIIPYSKDSVLACGNFLRNYHNQEIERIKNQVYSEDIKKQVSPIHKKRIEAVDLIIGSLSNIIPIEPNKLPTDPLENEKVGKNFIESRKLSQS